MSLLVDTSVWSLALRYDVERSAPEVVALRQALHRTDQVFTTGLVLRPDKDDHIEASEVRNSCRRRGMQVGTIDALLIQLCRSNFFERTVMVNP